MTDSSTALPTTRLAAVAHRYGGPDEIGTESVPMPSIADDEVLIKVEAAGLDRGVTHLMTGRPYLIRIMGYGFRRPKQPVLGMDVAGRVVAIGAKVDRFEIGDRVFGIADGSIAEYSAAKQDKLVTIPDQVGSVDAAVSAVSGITALQAVDEQAAVSPGQHVLVIGGSGGVGSFAVQIAKARGATVTAVGGRGTSEQLRGIGADHTVDYTTDDFADTETRYDVIIDTGGRNTLRRLRSVLAPTGTLVIVGGEGGNSLTGGIGRQLRAALMSPFLRQNLKFFMSTEHYDYIARLADLLAAGQVRPAVSERFSLEHTADGVRRLEQRGTFGKMAIVVDAPIG